MHCRPLGSSVYRSCNELITSPLNSHRQDYTHISLKYHLNNFHHQNPDPYTPSTNTFTATCMLVGRGVRRAHYVRELVVRIC